MRPPDVPMDTQESICPVLEGDDLRAGVKAVLSPARWAENLCLEGREGGIQASRRGWVPSIWEMSA
jgi:hypothetical protein